MEREKGLAMSYLTYAIVFGIAFCVAFAMVAIIRRKKKSG